MKVLFLTHQGDLAGSTNSIFYLSDGLANRGHDIYVGCRKESLLFSLLKNSKAQAVNMTFHGRFDMENMRQIRDLVREKDIDVINARISSYTAESSHKNKKRNNCYPRFFHPQQHFQHTAVQFCK
ncbi:MAG: glycosyltransferase [Bacteroidota bacterium]